VATIEKALGLTNSLIEVKRLEEVGLFIADELHLLGESNGRGCTLEGLLTKLLYIQGDYK
jgi:replicative superfamily II helicase